MLAILKQSDQLSKLNRTVLSSSLLKWGSTTSSNQWSNARETKRNAQLQRTERVKQIHQWSISRIMLMLPRFKLEHHHRKLEHYLIQVQPTHGSLIRKLHYPEVLNQSSLMMKQNPQLTNQFLQNKELRLLLGQEVCPVTLLQILWHLANAHLERETTKLKLRTRNSEVLINKKPSSQELILKLLLD